MKVDRFSSWCKFCKEWLILGTEPGYSLFMSAHRIIPSFRPFWKSGLILRPSIQLRSCALFWGSYVDRSQSLTSAKSPYEGSLLNCMEFMAGRP